ncbi:MAG: response regulator [Sphingobium sp.]|nr:response regulator [Sphingobium sp.]
MPLVLVVDDVQEIVEELTALLALVDIPALGAYSLSQALTVLESETAIRLIACDVRLSRESGPDIIQKVADSETLAHRQLKYLFMTGDPMRPDAIAVQQHCVVLTKPVQPNELITHLREMLEIKGGEQ